MISEQILRALAEQAYAFHLLVKTLREQGQLQEGSPLGRWNRAEFEEFLSRFQREHFPGES